MQTLPKRILIVGYTSLDQARAKGLVSERPGSYDVWYNPGNSFELSIVFIPFGSREVDVFLTPSIRYIEWSFLKRSRRLQLLHFPIHLIRAKRFVEKLIYLEGVEVVRANGPHLPALIMFMVKLRTKIPTILFIEAFWERLLPAQKYMPKLIRGLLPIWYRFVYRFFDVYCGTPSVNRAYFVDRGMRSGKIAAWTHELDLEALVLEAQKNEASEIKALPSPRIVAVGRLHSEKYPVDLVEVLALVRVRYPNAQLILVGEGEMKDAVITRARDLGVAEGITITGAVSQEKGAAIVKECDIYTAPMQGNALVEAMALGKPIVAYDHEWHRNLIQDNLTGILVKYRNTAEMAQAVIDLLGNRDLAQQLGQAASDAAFELHGQDAVTAKLCEPFSLALKSR